MNSTSCTPVFPSFHIYPSPLQPSPKRKQDKKNKIKINIKKKERHFAAEAAAFCSNSFTCYVHWNESLSSSRSLASAIFSIMCHHRDSSPPVVAPCCGDPAALIMQDQSLHLLQPFIGGVAVGASSALCLWASMVSELFGPQLFCTCSPRATSPAGTFIILALVLAASLSFQLFIKELKKLRVTTAVTVRLITH